MLKYSKIENLTIEKKISQTKIAQIIGMTREGYGRMLRDKTMKVSILEKIASIFEVPITYFFEEETELQSGEVEHKTNDEFSNLENGSNEIDNLIEEVHYQKQMNKALLNLVSKQKTEIEGLQVTVDNLERSTIGDKSKEV